MWLVLTGHSDLSKLGSDSMPICMHAGVRLEYIYEYDVTVACIEVLLLYEQRSLFSKIE